MQKGTHNQRDSLEIQTLANSKNIEKPNTINVTDYNSIYTPSNFYKRFYQCCSGVRWKTSTTQFELGLICEVADALCRIRNGTYRADGFVIFKLNERGKTRDIAALKILDRGVQKVLNQDILLPVYSQTFVEGNSASIKGKGIDWAINFLEKQLIAHFEKYHNEGGIYLFDFKNYFGSLEHNTLKKDIRENISDERSVKLLTDGVNDFRKMPTAYRDKNNKYHGVGLGSEISQTFSLSYVNKLDQFVISLQNEGVQYGRYMDDGYVICNDFNKLKQIREQIHNIVQEMGLELNQKKDRIIPFKHHQFTFLKNCFQLTDTRYVIITPVPKNIKRVREKIRKFRKLLDNKQLNIEDICHSYNGMRAHLLRSKNSYKTVHNLDCYFISTFRKELAKRDKSIKTYLKTFQNKEGEWVYITKSLENSKNYHHKHQQQVNTRYKRMSKEQKDKYFKKKRNKKGNIKIKAVYDPEFIQGVKRKNEKPCR